MSEVKGKAIGVALMSSLSYSFCSVSMVMSNKASLCFLCLARLLVAPVASVGYRVRFDRVLFLFVWWFWWFVIRKNISPLIVGGVIMGDRYLTD